MSDDDGGEDGDGRRGDYGPSVRPSITSYLSCGRSHRGEIRFRAAIAVRTHPASWAIQNVTLDAFSQI